MRSVDQENLHPILKRINFLYSQISDGQNKWYQCMLCDFKSISRCEITKHFLKHSNAKNFKCSSCSFTTYRKSEFETHQKSHKLCDESNDKI